MYIKPLLVAGIFARHAYAWNYKYVAVFSVDGMHASDVEKYLVHNPKGNIAALLSNGYEYTNCYTSAPSDSFPGTMNVFTGSSPRTTGIWYDDTWDRSMFAPGSSCKGSPGAESKKA
jgi:predicted AlkP superfamily pyrophosphatase or phosphodiesterase